MIMEGCQGKPRTPTISEKICPNCGNPIEIFSTDTQVACDKCGFVVYNDTLSCVQWCKYARQCVGDADVRADDGDCANGRRKRPTESYANRRITHHDRRRIIEIDEETLHRLRPVREGLPRGRHRHGERQGEAGP